ncbi:MAG: DUF1801 domain-containing protein [Phenylobacterium sp.]|uniref:iron chaperone n=1 Tax=Phenylobacterium sp. TaxID=1871053 RepID=UPI001B61F3A9|nr:DUF1801 domain-containing protein [Phenylobacterium sp.]MBP7650478.1 DUF1801 domain-containing protein [Phenylobacterium sp.]MBP7817360.1 DUF1801 domain-containing protein [Phenylobacterium sp.]MBP9231085.1 DUF1801 domain-containing protein [Phenylobacterium sp.]MBP9754206.1 DUF1801 domain-containing protein [Phenylobacterium sp.]
MPAPADTDAYLATVPEPQREALQVLRRQLLAAAPGATECVSYGMPAIRRTGVLVWFAAGKAHCALYPSGLVAEFADRLTGYQTSKGAIRFQPEKPLPPQLIADIVARRIEQDEAAAAARAAKRKR